MRNSLWLLLLPIWVSAQVVAGRSGIPAIDSLPIHEWDVPTKNVSLGKAMLWGALIPGGSQFYQDHKVRGGFLLGFESALAMEVFVTKPLQQQRRIADFKVARDSASYYTAQLLEYGFSTAADQKRRYYLELGRTINDAKLKEEDLRKSEMAWMFGLHLYGLMDGYGIWRNNQGHSTEQRPVDEALWRAILVPGWGQIYNQEYGKAGLLYMAILGGCVSFVSRQHMVDYLKDRLHTAQVEGESSVSATLQEDLLFYRKKRNQYIWGLTLFYLYSIADATVDAALSDFDSPNYWALQPYWGGDLGLQASYNLSF